MVSGIPAPRAGEYRLTAGSITQTIGASLLSTSETSLEAVSEMEFGDRISVAASDGPAKADRSLWWTLMLAAFVVLLAAWWFQGRPV
jgi:hypothetical protein